MSVNFDQLKQLGTITGLESATQLGPLINVATKFGAGTATEWLASATGASGIASAITSGLGGNISGLISGSGIGGALTGGVNNLLSGGVNNLLSGGVNNLLSGGVGSLLSGGTSSLLSGGVGSLLSGGAGSLLSGGVGGLISSGLSSVPGLSSVLNGFAQSAQFAQVFSFASSFLGGGGNPLEAGTVTPPAAANTVNRQTVNQAVLAIIGNSKISIPDFVPSA